MNNPARAIRACAEVPPPASVIGVARHTRSQAASTDPAVLAHLRSDGDVWLLDPLDGTANFVAGESPFALMAALVRGGETIASWMLDPVSDRLAIAEAGAGAWLDGERVHVQAGEADVSAMRGAVLRRFLPPEVLSHVEGVEPVFDEVTAGSGCAGHDYPSVVTGELDFVLFWRTLPWDHIPGALFVSEAGGVAARLDGGVYTAADHGRRGLLVARDAGVWGRVRHALLPEHID